MRAQLLTIGFFVFSSLFSGPVFATDVETGSELSTEPHPLVPGTIELSPAITAFPNSADPSAYQIKQAVIPVQVYFLENISLGAVSMYFAPGFTHASPDPTKPLLLVGPQADVTFLQSGNWSADAGGSVLFQPNGDASFISPQVGLHYFVSNNISVGLVYNALLDLRSDLLSIRTDNAPGDGHSVLIQISTFR